MERSAVDGSMLGGWLGTDKASITGRTLTVDSQSLAGWLHMPYWGLCIECSAVDMVMPSLWLRTSASGGSSLMSHSGHASTGAFMLTLVRTRQQGT